MNLIVEISNNINLILDGEYTAPDPGVYYYPDGRGQPPSPSKYEIEEAEIEFITWKVARDNKRIKTSLFIPCPDEVLDLYYDKIMIVADEEYDNQKGEYKVR